MKRLKIAVTIMFFALTSRAQYYNQTYDYNGFTDLGLRICELNNEVFFAGRFINTSISAAGIYLRKLDQSGNVLLTKEYIWPNVGVDLGLSGSMRPFLGGLVATGAINLPSEALQNFVIRMDENGDSLFTKVFQHGVESRSKSLHPNEDGTIIIFGESRASASATIDLTIWKLDSMGNVLWVQAFPNAGEDFCVGGTVDDDGNIYISGGNGVYPNEKGLIIKADSMGTYIHKKTYLTNIGMGVTYYDGSLYAKSVQYYSSNSNDLRLVLLKINTNLDTIWTRYYTNMPYTASSTAPILINDRMYLAGNREENIKKGILLMSDTLGQIQFQRIYQSVPVGSTHFITDMTPTSDGGFALVGWTSNPGQNAWVVKVDSLGCLVPNCALSEEELPATTAIQVWPNPTSGRLHLRLPENSSPAELTLTDITGRAVHHEQLPANTTELLLELHHLPSGMYFLQVRGDAGILFTEKIVRQ